MNDTIIIECPECDGSGRVSRIDGPDLCDVCKGGQ